MLIPNDLALNLGGGCFLKRHDREVMPFFDCGQAWVLALSSNK